MRKASHKECQKGSCQSFTEVIKTIGIERDKLRLKNFFK